MLPPDGESGSSGAQGPASGTRKSPRVSLQRIHSRFQGSVQFFPTPWHFLGVDTVCAVRRKFFFLPLNFSMF